ncbi:Inclusion body protein [Paraburkholderia phenazinium]|uniref:Inclusion body protein n=1 Tax=Paraburkholderia phenazinium TaxID=60549 RepID=A0A1G7Z0T4_9BURK|nr:Inclusion body protein [Paraburkholderia phenazinium]
MNTRTHGIDVLLVIDAAHIKNVYGPNQEPAHPVRVAPDCLFMICAGSRGIACTQDAEEPGIRAKAGDSVFLRGTSMQGNADDAVILYKVRPASGGCVFERFKANAFLRAYTVRPDPDSPDHNGLPALKSEASFLSFESKVKALGNEVLEMTFALYAFNATRTRQEPYGYYSCNRIVTIC